MTSENREDYLISILRLTEGERSAKTTELASFMNVSPASVSEMLKTLSNDGLVRYEKYRGVKLTDEGLSLARQVRKKHHVVEKFLKDVLEVDAMDAHNEAHSMEHVITDGSMVKMCRIIGNHVDDDCKACPSPCKAISPDSKMKSVCLKDYRAGDSGTILFIKSDDPDIAKGLIAMGFIPGHKVRMEGTVAENGSLIMIVAGNTLVISPIFAASVFMEI